MSHRIVTALTALTAVTAVTAIWLAACSGSSAQAPGVTAANAAAIAAAPDRTDKDKAQDGFRKPVDLLTFFGTAPGMHVADLGAGGGYATELEARAVGPTGTVFAQDTPNWGVEGLTKVWTARLERPVLKNTKHELRQWDDPLPGDVKDLDAVYFVAAYHDVKAEKGDTNKLNAAVFAALKSGGVYVVLDNSAKEGSGTADCERLHRIDEKVVRDEVAAAGFKLSGEGNFMRNPADTRDWNADPGADPKSHTQDLFGLRFVKP